MSLVSFSNVMAIVKFSDTYCFVHIPRNNAYVYNDEIRIIILSSGIMEVDKEQWKLLPEYLLKCCPGGVEANGRYTVIGLSMECDKECKPI